ncbi:MAG: hypothetical protein U5O39_07075 [Gammaproteobacteria bacterium]|nr:hypothetical protein [Gammaproteobacteria bacterium]
MINWFKRLFSDYPEGDELVTLMAAAREDMAMRQHLLLLLTHEDFQRQSLINSWVAEMRMQGAPACLIRAISSLADNDCAYRAREILDLRE